MVHRIPTEFVGNRISTSLKLGTIRTGDFQYCSSSTIDPQRRALLARVFRQEKCARVGRFASRFVGTVGVNF